MIKHHGAVKSRLAAKIGAEVRTLGVTTLKDAVRAITSLLAARVGPKSIIGHDPLTAPVRAFRNCFKNRYFTTQERGIGYSFQLAITAPLYSIIGYCIATAQSYPNHLISEILSTVSLEMPCSTLGSMFFTRVIVLSYPLPD